MSVPVPEAPVDEIRFFHRGEIVRLRDVPPTRSVLDWLREDQRCTGTKEGCNEGDCGACTVVVGELPGRTDSPQQAVRGLRLRPINACIRFMPSLHGKALFTVEDLRGPHGLHPAQQALVDCHGSQCGFCTPGFAMTLWCSYVNHGAAGTRPDRAQLADELAGNLCRCTGYRPILDAGARMFEQPPVLLDTAPAIAALQAIAGAPAPGAPRTLAELAQRYAAAPKARLVAGGTDVGLWVTKQFRDLGQVISVTEVDEMKSVAHADGELRIGAGASLEAAWAALAQRAPSLAEAWRRFASPPIRHAGTMGGNVANGSPIGDSAPVLMALDAQLELRQGPRVRRLPLDDFYTGYQANRLEPGEFVQAIVVPDTAWARALRAYKISKRFDSDISAVFAALAIRLDGGRVGRRAPRVRRPGRGGQARRGCRGGATRPTLDRRHPRRRPVRPRGRFRPAGRHARQRGVPDAGGAEPVAAVLAGDAGRRDDVLRTHLDLERGMTAAAAGVPESAHAGVGASRPHESAHLHVAGAATYVDDIPELVGTLHCALGLSPVAHGRLRGMELDRIRALPGVVDVFAAADIPGHNDCGPILHDDPILADGVLRHVGQPVFAVVARTRGDARRAAAKAREVLDIEPLEPVLAPREAHARGLHVIPPIHLVRDTLEGGARAAIVAAPHRLADSLDVGGQEQFYLEGQISYAVPTEDEGMKIHCSTQHPSRCSTWSRTRWACSRTTCTWSAGAWAAASAARSRSRHCSPASRRWRRGAPAGP